MRSLAVLAFAACASTPKSPEVPVAPPCPAEKVAPVAVSAAPELDDASVKAKSHTFLDALDKFDKATAMDLLAPSFVRFGRQRFANVETLGKTFDAEIEQHLPVQSRTYADERTFIETGSAVYIGHTTLHVPPDGEHAAAEVEAWNTLVWVRTGDRWRLAHWQVAPAGLEGDRQMWDEMFAQSIGFNLKPNQLLVDTVKGKKPGTALDIAMGQGRNAVFLATQGWKVTGVDISEEGMRIAREAAAAKKVKLETVSSDIAKYDFGKDKWDLVTLIYAGTNHDLIERVKPSLKKGGLFVVEFFAKDATKGTGVGGFAPGELAALFKDGFKILVDQQVEDHADWAGQRKTQLARFVAQKL